MIPSMRRLLPLFGSFLLVLACSDDPLDDDTTPTDDDDVAAGDTLDPCSFAPDPTGSIHIEEGYFTRPGDAEPGWHGQVGAQLWDGPSPAVYSEVLAGDDPDACVRLDIRAPTRGHGLTITAFLSCVGPDDGLITVPAGLLALFPESACPVNAGADCHYSELTRYTAQTVETISGDLTLEVRSAVYFYYDHRR